jgi:MFS family permease
MFKVLSQSWPLLLGVMLLMVGNGVQSSLLGIRGAAEGFTTFQLSIVMSAYFVGFLGGARLAPEMIRRVGHVRVFSAMGSMVSALLILYPLLVDWMAWSVMRVVLGFCFSGIYIAAESWLNNSASNETRGKTLSTYMIVQMLGIIASQGLLAMGDTDGFALFIVPSILVSLSFLPILLATGPAPAFATTKAMSFRELFKISPLGCAGMVLTGGVFSAMFGMASVYGTLMGMSVAKIAGFVSAMYVGGLLLQYPIGQASDRLDRRAMILWMSLAGAAVMGAAGLFQMPYLFELIAAALLGGIINPLYSLLIAHANDYLNQEEMPAASAGLIFLNGFGAISGPLVAGWLMGAVGPQGYFYFIGTVFAMLGAYAAWRMTRRAAPEQGSYSGLTPTASAVVVEAMLEDAVTDPRD